MRRGNVVVVGEWLPCFWSAGRKKGCNDDKCYKIGWEGSDVKNVRVEMSQ